MNTLNLPVHSTIEQAIGRHISVKDGEAQHLAWLGAQVPPGGLIVECGSFWGRSAAYIISGAAAGVRMICIDKWQNPVDQEKFLRNIGKVGYTDRITAVRSVTWEAAGELPADAEIDMLFLDSTHTYAVLEREWATFFPLVKPGGIVAFHDYGAQTWPDVQRFVDEVAAEHLQLIGHEGTAWSGRKREQLSPNSKTLEEAIADSLSFAPPPKLVEQRAVISVIFPYTKAFGDFATPYTESIHQHEPAVQVVGVNTEGKADYRYTQALNQGAMQAIGDWLLFSNDDILCQGEFVDLVQELDPNKIYGMELRNKTKDEWGADVEYLYGWILLMHRQLYEAVGPFEEQYLHAGFDDIDYCWRAQQAGFGLAVVDLPFIHLADQPGGKHRRYTVPGYREQMARSKEIFLAKVASAGK